jgi:Protein of unknown function (DUF2934)
MIVMVIDRCPLTVDEKEDLIAKEAYYRYEKRGFTEADSTADWLEAEAEIERQLNELCWSQPQKPESTADRAMRLNLRGALQDLDKKAENTIRESFGRISEKAKPLEPARLFSRVSGIIKAWVNRQRGHRK